MLWGNLHHPKAVPIHQHAQQKELSSCPTSSASLSVSSYDLWYTTKNKIVPQLFKCWKRCLAWILIHWSLYLLTVPMEMKNKWGPLHAIYKLFNGMLTMGVPNGDSWWQSPRCLMSLNGHTMHASSTCTIFTKIGEQMSKLEHLIGSYTSTIRKISHWWLVWASPQGGKCRGICQHLGYCLFATKSMKKSKYQVIKFDPKRISSRTSMST